jgi:hypothetical protein
MPFPFDFLLSTLVLILHCSWGYSANTVLHYEPAIVELTGIIEQQTFPGPPGYESIASGDDIEKGWYLRLSEPVDVVATKIDAPSASSETEKDVKIMQLTWNSSGPEKAIRSATKAKKKVRLKGHLFHRLSGHHHSRVLMWVNKLNEIKP